MPVSCCPARLVSEESVDPKGQEGSGSPSSLPWPWPLYQIATPPIAPSPVCPGEREERLAPEVLALVTGFCAPHSLDTEPVASGPRLQAEQSRAGHLEALRRQLQVELKVKQGAENMAHTCASGTPKVRPWGLVGRHCPGPQSDGRGLAPRC